MTETPRKDAAGVVRLGVVGAGNWGRNLVRNFAALPATELAYICDLDPKVRLAMQALYPEAVVTDRVEAVLGDPAVDAVVVAVDAPLHYSIAKSALEAGKHTYVEKPLTLNSAQAIELNALAGRTGRKLMVGHLLEYHPAVNYIRDLIRDGKVGEPLYLYFQRLNLGIVRQTENAWWSLAPHDVSVACYLFGGEPVSVSATGQAYLQKGIEDVVFANLKFADGRMAHIHVSWLDPHKIRRMTLVSTAKMVVLDDMEVSEKVRIYDKGAEVKSADSYAEAIALRIGDILIPKVPAQEPLQIECRHFVEAVLKDQPVRSDGADGVRVVKVLEAGSRSLAEGGRPVSI
ncbi:MAG: Gfo/Idh/MocA family oxidoreductase [Phycisphaerae bacterium]|jgi:predicted dehydrogenase